MGFGQLPYDVAHLLSGGVLLCSFVLLYQRRAEALIGALATQGALLALAAAWQGWVQEAPQLYATALIALIAKAVLIPLALRAMMRRFGIASEVEAALGIGLSMALGSALVALALLVALPAASSAGALAREDLGIALAVALLGMLMMITRRNAISQVVGLMSLENGVILGAVGVAGMPLVVELSTAGLVLVIAVVAGLFASRIRERFATLDTHELEPHRGETR
jgi:hydrogenase-4 component E